jgi:Putative Ig domain
LVRTLATSARSGKRTTRTTLAIVGFSLLGVVVVAIFGLSGQGVRDLRSQVIAAITTLVATIAGFYFGADAAQNAGGQGGPAAVAPGLLADPTNPAFVVGRPGTYTPKVTGTPPPTVSLSQGTLPSSLQLNPATGVISGTPASGTENTYAIMLTAANGIVPDATLPLTLTVSATPVTVAPGLEADPTNPTFVVGQPGIYTPKVTGAPPPAVSVSQGSLPPDLAIDPATGIISGTPAPGTENTYAITLTAANSVVPDATLSLTLTVSASS